MYIYMKVLLLYLLIATFLVTNCKSSKVSPTVDHKSLNKEKVSLKNGKTYPEEDLDINEIKNKSGCSVLYKAVDSNNLQEVNRLLSLGANPNIGGRNFSPLEVAVWNKNKEMVSLLLSYGAKIIFQEDGGARVLDYVRYGKDGVSKEIYTLLVARLSPEEINQRSTLLLQAVRQNDLGKVKELLSLGADPNISDESFEFRCPLYDAVCNKNKEMVSLLLSHGAEVRFDKDGKSDSLTSLVLDNDQELLSIILCHFADIGKKDSVGLSPIHWACRDGHLNVVKHILSKDPAFIHNSDNPYKFTPLHWASRRGFKEIVTLLVSKGASKTATSKSGFTPLMLAISNKHEALKDILSPDGFVRHSKLVEKDWQCSICLEGLNDCIDKILPVIPLDCGHRFHFRCITKNVQTQQENNQTINCPNCRSGLSGDVVQKIVSNAGVPHMSAFSTLNAVNQKDISKLKYLLEKGGNPNESSITNAVLEGAVRQSNDEIVFLLRTLKKLAQGGNPNELFLASSTLEGAVRQSNDEMVSLLLDYGADPTYQDPSTKNTPLHYAANMLHKGNRQFSQDVCDKIFIALIKNGAIVNSENLKCEMPRNRLCSCDDPLFVLAEAGGIRSGWFDDIQPAFGLSGRKIKQKILFGKELEWGDYHAKL